MNGSTWMHDPYTNKRHHPDCPVWLNAARRCTCEEREDELVQDYVASVSAPQGQYMTLAGMIRAARRAGHLRPVQGYGGGHAPASTP